MHDVNGQLIRVGDRLDVGHGWSIGVVVCSIDTGDYSPKHPKEQWGYLERGIMVETEKGGLIHYEENDGELEIIESTSS